MGLFEKRPVVTSSAPAYTIGATKTILVAGLGNPGKEYNYTRHNIGFAVLDDFAANNDFPSWTAKKDLKGAVTTLTMGEAKVVLVKSLNYMNESGQALAAVQHYYRVHNPETLVVYDELAVPFGSLRTRLGGSDAGHNGVKSAIAHLGEDFGRLRVGIGNDIAEKADSADFVLGRFSKAEQTDLAKIIREAEVLITEFIFSGQLPHETRKVI